MLQRLIFRSPWGLALTAAAVVLAVSPQARQSARKAARKGMVCVLSFIDRSQAVAGRMQGWWTHVSASFRQMELPPEAIMPVPAFRERSHGSVDAMVPPEGEAAIGGPYNVWNGDFLERVPDAAERGALGSRMR